MQQLPLVIFTVLEQLAVGAMVTLVVLQLAGKLNKEKNAAFTVSLVVFILAAVALVASLFHLGHPMRSVTALAGLGSSWLSREILFFGLFTLFALLYMICAKLGKEGAVKGLGIVAAILGIIAVVCTALCYMLPGVPAWNSAMTPIQFILCAALGGVSLAQAIRCGVEGLDSAKKWLIAAVIIIIVIIIVRVMFFSNIVLLVNTF